MQYCQNCKQNVEPKKNISVIGLIILLLLFLVPGIIYLIYCLVQKPKCPICKSQNWGIGHNSGSNNIE